MDKYSTLDSIIRQLLLEQGETTDRRYFTYLTYGYAFLNGEYPAQEQGGKTLKTTLLQVGYDRSVTLPSDYVELVSVGRIVGSKVRNLAYNASIVPAALTQNPSNLIGYGNMGQAPQQAWPVFNYWGWESLGLTGWDGCGYGWGEWRDEFVIDKERGVLHFSTSIGGPDDGPLLLQYQSNDLAPGKPTPIHPYWQQALKNWMLWMWYLKAKENVNLAREHERLYNKERSKAIQRTDPTNAYEAILHQLWQSYNTLR